MKCWNCGRELTKKGHLIEGPFVRCEYCGYWTEEKEGEN